MKRAASCLFVSSLLLISVFSFSAHAGTVEDLQAKIAERNKIIADLEADIKAYQGKIGETSEQAKTLKNALATIDLEIKKLEKQTKETEAQIGKTDLTLQSLAQTIADKEVRIRTDREAVGAAIREVESAEKSTPIESFLSQTKFSSVWEQIDASLQLSDALRYKIADLRKQKASLESDKKAKEGEKTKLVDYKATLKNQQLLAAVNKKDKNTLLADTKNKESEYQKQLAKKEAEKAAFAAELFEYESQLKIAIDPSKIATAGKGVLSWPLAKVTITQLFGKTADSKRLYTSGTHNGVDFGIPKGTTVKAALSGTVAGSGNTDLFPSCYSFGKWVMIDHHNGLSTMYAHLSVIGVEVGQNVTTGQSLGLSGATGYATGPHLHFGLYATQAVTIKKFANSTACKNAVLPLSPPEGYLDPMQYLPKA